MMFGQNLSCTTCSRHHASLTGSTMGGLLTEESPAMVDWPDWRVLTWLCRDEICVFDPT